MSLKSLPIPPIPEEVVRVARVAFPRGNVFMQVRDTLGAISTDEAFADLFPTHGQPALAPWRLALVTIFQFLEGLTDRQAADAVRDRLAWKYALSLELCDSGFDHPVLSEFRARLAEGKAEQRLFDVLLQRCREAGWLKARGRQRTDSTHVLAKIRSLSRTLRVAQTMVYVLNVFSEVAPHWIRAHVPVEWVERYGQRLEEERLPKEEQERTRYANQVGADGWMLLDALQAPCTPDWLKTLPAVTTLLTMWEQQFEAREQGGQWRKEPALPAAQLIASPYDPDARNAKKRATFWTGYKVHVTQTCDEDAPQLITHVETTPATTSDESIVSAIHAGLSGKELLPDQHLVESGYVTAANLVESQSSYYVDLVGPTLKTHWYQAETGHDLTHFSIDWEAETVTCPQGHVSSSWGEVHDAGKTLIKVKFSQSDGKVCPSQALCTGTKRRTMTLHPKARMQALLTARQREETEEYKQLYRHRAGIEGVHSQGVRALGLRRSRSIGLLKTHLSHVAIAAAVNLIQLTSWLRGEVPEPTRISPFKRLMQQAA
ncbi:MAG: IS1182 family transposase [Ktedonobacteraceae bacterium]|nr:IS1182 family transposase [Ktedonobacteraceae bacterium]